MANNDALKVGVKNVIKQNGVNAITGQILQTVLLNIINALGSNSQYVGVATPTTNPNSPDGFVFYVTTTPGTYTNFGNIVVQDGYLTVLKNTASGSWVKDEIKLPAVTAGAQYVGVAGPTTNPGTPDGLVFYLTTTPGTYVNFNNLPVKAGYLTVLKNTKTGGWALDEFAIGGIQTEGLNWGYVFKPSVEFLIENNTIYINSSATGMLIDSTGKTYQLPTQGIYVTLPAGSDLQLSYFIYRNETFYCKLEQDLLPTDVVLMRVYGKRGGSQNLEVLQSSVPYADNNNHPGSWFTSPTNVWGFTKLDFMLGGEIVIYPRSNCYIKTSGFYHYDGSQSFAPVCNQTGVIPQTFAQEGTYILAFNKDTDTYVIETLLTYMTRGTGAYSTSLYITAIFRMELVNGEKTITEFWTTSPRHVTVYNQSFKIGDWASKLDIKTEGVIDFQSNTQQIIIKSGTHRSIPGSWYEAPIINQTRDATENARKTQVAGIYGVFRDINWGNYILIQLDPYWTYENIKYCYLSALFKIENNGTASLMWASKTECFTLNGQPIPGGGDATIIAQLQSQVNNAVQTADEAKATADEAKAAAESAIDNSLGIKMWNPILITASETIIAPGSYIVKYTGAIPTITILPSGPRMVGTKEWNIIIIYGVNGYNLSLYQNGKLYQPTGSFKETNSFLIPVGSILYITYSTTQAPTLWCSRTL